MSTGFAADTENLRNEGVIYVECNPIKCMFWETTKTQKKRQRQYATDVAKQLV